MLVCCVIFTFAGVPSIDIKHLSNDNQLHNSYTPSVAFEIDWSSNAYGDDDDAVDAPQGFWDCVVNGRNDASIWRQIVCGIGGFLVGAAALTWGPAAQAIAIGAAFTIKGTKFNVPKGGAFLGRVAALGVAALSYRLCMCGDKIF